jgi:hypothetical protein
MSVAFGYKRRRCTQELLKETVLRCSWLAADPIVTAPATSVMKPQHPLGFAPGLHVC